MSVDSSTNYFGIQLASPLAASVSTRTGRIGVLGQSECRGATALLASSWVTRQAFGAAPLGSFLTSDSTWVKRFSLAIDAGEAAIVVAAPRVSSLATNANTQPTAAVKRKPYISLHRRLHQSASAVQLRYNRGCEPDGSRKWCNMKWAPGTNVVGEVESELHSIETGRHRLTVVSRSVLSAAHERLTTSSAVKAVFVKRIFGLLCHGVEHLREIPAEMLKWSLINRSTRVTFEVGSPTSATYNRSDRNERANCALHWTWCLRQGQRFWHLAVNCNG